MADNQLEYGYLEGESGGERFAEDPVGTAVVLCVGRRVFFFCFFGGFGVFFWLVCARARGPSERASERRARAALCGVIVCVVNGAFSPHAVSTPL